MKILSIHNFHRKGSASGDDLVYNNEAELLRSHGNTVIQYSVSNDDFDRAGFLQKVSYTLGMIWSRENYKAVRSLIREEKPDIVHIHTFFPLLSPSVLYAAKRENVKVVATLHDMRFFCPCVLSVRCSSFCNKCADGHYLRMFWYKCFKNSRIQSLYVAGIFKYHQLRKSFYHMIDRYICLNDNQIRLLKQTGFDITKIVKKYNFVADAAEEVSDYKPDGLPERYVVFYGRIGEEKGVRWLMEIWEKLNDIPLVIMGSGPLEQELTAWADGKENVFYLGFVKHKQCLDIVKEAEFVVFPSVRYEGCDGCPLVEIEAESLNKAIITTDFGFSEDSITDILYKVMISPGDTDTFAETVKALWEHPEQCAQMGTYARANYEAKFMPEDNYRQLMRIYEDVIKEK